MPLIDRLRSVQRRDLKRDISAADQPTDDLKEEQKRR